MLGNGERRSGCAQASRVKRLAEQRVPLDEHEMSGDSIFGTVVNARDQRPSVGIQGAGIQALLSGSETKVQEVAAIRQEVRVPVPQIIRGQRDQR
jgi:hypothetical protein